MPNVYTTIYYIMAGIAFFLGLMHVRFSLNPGEDRTNLFFGLWAISLAPFYLMVAASYKATDTAQYFFYVKAYVFFGVFQHPLLAWFISHYTKYRRRLFLWALSAMFFLLGIVNFFTPYSILCAEFTELATTTFFGETLSYAVMSPGIWAVLAMLAIFSIIPFGYYAGYRQYKDGEKKAAIHFGALLSVYLLVYIQDILMVTLFKIDMIVTIDFIPMIFMVLMSNRLNRSFFQHIEIKKELVKNEERWRTLLENVKLLVVGIDQEGIVTYVNPHTLAVTGFDEKQLLRQSWLVTFLPQREQERVRMAFHQRFQSHFMNAILTKDGEERIVAWANVAMYNRDGDWDGTLIVGKDITEQLQAEHALKAAYEEVETLKNRLQEENLYLQEEIISNYNFQEIIGQSPVLKYVLKRVEQVAAADTSVFLEGETGVGKELFARAIHQHSACKHRPLIKVNCAAIPTNLLESELFGHEKGAFTSAEKRRRGRFELADGGTLFLDEIGELSPELQSKLLRVLQDGEFERVGGENTIKANVRIIAATNRKLKQEVEAGRFREDLYYRLRVYPISIPPLRQRHDDISLLVNAFVQRYAKKHGKQIDQISPYTLEMLQEYHWPGNVRELQNVIERAVLTTQGSILQVPKSFLESQPEDETQKLAQEKIATLTEIERDYILKILQHCHWKVEGRNGAAALLGMHPNTLRSRMKKHGIKRPSKDGPDTH